VVALETRSRIGIRAGARWKRAPRSLCGAWIESLARMGGRWEE
jgi:hypothetical protein